MTNWLKKFNTTDAIDVSKSVKKAGYGTKIEESEEKKYLTMFSMLLLIISINILVKYLMKDLSKQN